MALPVPNLDDRRFQDLVNEARQNEIVERKNADVARQQALDGFSQARATVDTWLTGASDALKYYPGMQRIRKRLLTQAAAEYESFAAHRSADAGLEAATAAAQQAAVAVATAALPSL